MLFIINRVNFSFYLQWHPQKVILCQGPCRIVGRKGHLCHSLPSEPRQRFLKLSKQTKIFHDRNLNIYESKMPIYK